MYCSVRSMHVLELEKCMHISINIVCSGTVVKVCYFRNSHIFSCMHGFFVIELTWKKTHMGISINLPIIISQRSYPIIAKSLFVCLFL